MKIQILYDKQIVHDIYKSHTQTDNKAEVEAIVISSKQSPNLTEYPNLKYIVTCSNGINHIDKNYCKEQNIKIINSPTANINATAEHTISLILTALRKIPQANQTMKQNRWDREEFYGKELNECKIGFIGFGNIAKLIHKKLQSLEPNSFLCYDPFLTKEQIEEYQNCTKIEDLNTLFKEADIISIHVPLLDQTRNMIAKEQLNMMKEDTILLNCSRGGIVNEADLINHLENNKNFTACLDTFENEPTPNENLTKLQNAICTPHLGSMTRKAQTAMITEAAENFTKAIKKANTSN